MTEIKYEDYKKLIYKIAWHWHRKTGIDFEELVGEGNVAFCNAKMVLMLIKTSNFAHIFTRR